MNVTRDKALHYACHDAAIVMLYPHPDPINQQMAEITVQRRFLLAKRCVEQFNRIRVTASQRSR